MAKVIAVTTLAWDDHRVTVSDEGIDIIFIGRSHEVIDQLKKFNVGDDFLQFEVNSGNLELAQKNSNLTEQLEELRATNERLREANHNLIQTNEQLREASKPKESIPTDTGKASSESPIEYVPPTQQ